LKQNNDLTGGQIPIKQQDLPDETTEEKCKVAKNISLVLITKCA
ncbi:11242_t:CDS:1, partial [Ambispora gerdemannii]